MPKTIKIIVYTFLLLGAFFVLPLQASDARFEATVDRNKIELGTAAQLNLTFYGIQNVGAPQLDKIEGFDTRYLGPSTMLSVVNGVVSSTVTHIYTLIPLKTGDFTIGPFQVDVAGKTLTAKSIKMEVISATSSSQNSPSGQSQQPFISKVNSEELKGRIFLTIAPGKNKVYLNEVIPLTVKLYLNQIGVRDIQFPELDTNNFSIEKFSQPKQYREQFNGVNYDVIELSTSMFGIKVGDFILGPAKMKCNLVLQRQGARRRAPSNNDFLNGFFKDDFFDDVLGNYEIYPLELKSEELPVTILPLPLESRPEGFDGNLGDFKLEVEVSPLEVKAGDPITLKMKVKGEGNFDTVNCPKLGTKDGFKVYDPQAKIIEGGKEFEQVLIPESEKISQIPEIKFSFFNTDTGQYQVLTHNPVPIIVSKSQERQAKIVELSGAQQGGSLVNEKIGRDIIYIKDFLGKSESKSGYLYQKSGFWLLQLIFFVLFCATLAFYFKQQKLKTDTRYARLLQAPAKAKKGLAEVSRLLKANKPAEFFDAVFKTIREYLADRLHLPSGGITATTVEEAAEEKNIDALTLNKIKKIFADCDMARYAPAQFSQEKMEEEFKDLKEIIETLGRQKR